MKMKMFFYLLLVLVVGSLVSPSFIFADDLVTIWDQYIPEGEHISWDGYHLEILGGLATMCRVRVIKGNAILFDETIDKGFETQLTEDMAFSFTETMIGTETILYYKIKVDYHFLCYCIPSWGNDPDPTVAPPLTTTPPGYTPGEIEIDYSGMWNIDAVAGMKTETLFFDVLNVGQIDITVSECRVNSKDNIVLSCFNVIKPSNRVIRSKNSAQFGIAFTPSTVFLNNFEGSEFIEFIVGNKDVSDSFYIVVNYYPSETVNTGGNIGTFKISINGQLKEIANDNKAYVGDLVYLIFHPSVKVNIGGWEVLPTEEKSGASWYYIPSQDAKLYTVNAGLRNFTVAVLNKAKETVEIPKQIVSVVPESVSYVSNEEVVIISQDAKGLKIDGIVTFPEWTVPYRDFYRPFSTKTNNAFRLPEVKEDTMIEFNIVYEGFRTYDGQILVKPKPMSFKWLWYLGAFLAFIFVVVMIMRGKLDTPGLPFLKRKESE